MTKPDRPNLRATLAQVHLQLVLFAVLLAAASLTLSGGLVIRDYAQRSLNLAAQAVAQRIESAMLHQDPATVADRIGSIAADGGVQQVDVIDRAGRLLVHWRSSRTAIPEWLIDYANRLFSHRVAVVPVVHGGSQIGEVRITANPEGLLRFVLAASFIACSTLAVTLIASGILAQRLHRHLAEPSEQSNTLTDGAPRE